MFVDLCVFCTGNAVLAWIARDRAWAICSPPKKQ
jgi:hypothetical protein